MGLNSISIANFRGIASPLSVRLAPITLIGGRNNSGKSTILEAIRLLAGRRDASIPAEVNAVSRKIALRVREDLQTLFFDEKEAVNISATMDTKRTCAVSIRLQKKAEGEISSTETHDTSLVKSTRWELVQVGEDVDADGHKRERTSRLTPRVEEEGKFGYTTNKAESEIDWGCELMSASSRGAAETNEIFSQMTVALQDREISAVINKIYPEIFTVKLVDSQLMVKVRGIEKLLPAKIAGDGVVRMISVLCAMWKCPGGTLCVDEIDNGLHYSVLKDFWHAVADFSKKFNVQLVATTHHLELLETLSKMVVETGDYERAEYVRISHAETGHSVSIFGGKDLERALKLGFELRG